MSYPKKSIAGFTLIELLIVVAIIAILAAIAVPNFLEAQVRAKVSRGQNDMRAIATALESYKIDTNLYPPDYQYYQGFWFGLDDTTQTNQFAQACLARLTTPVAYMTSLPRNVFQFTRGAWDGDSMWYGYKTRDWWGSIVGPNILSTSPVASDRHQWILLSVGPDQAASGGEYALFGIEYICSMPPSSFFGSNGPAVYDATNGTISAGDIVRVGP